MELNRENLEALSKAKQQVTNGQLTLWNVRLEAMAQTGDLRAVVDLLSAAIADDINNCGCNVQCGALNEISVRGQTR